MTVSCFVEIPVFNGNSVDPDQMLHSAASDMGLHCLTITLLGIFQTKMGLTLKAPRKTASENVVCLCLLLNILANFSNLFFAYRQTVWTLIRLLLKEQSDLGPHCLQK